MDPVVVGVLLVAGYMIVTGGRQAGADDIGRRGRGSRGGATVSPRTGTAITIPGIGSYINLPDGTVSIGVDPRFFGNLAPEPQTPDIAMPGDTVGYDEGQTVMTAPVTPWDWVPSAVPNPPNYDADYTLFA